MLPLDKIEDDKEYIFTDKDSICTIYYRKQDDVIYFTRMFPDMPKLKTVKGLAEYKAWWKDLSDVNYFDGGVHG